MTLRWPMVLALAFCLALATGYPFASSNRWTSTGEARPFLISGRVDYTDPDGTQYSSITDVQGYRSMAELVKASDVVVVGKVVAKAGVKINLERDPANPAVEHPTRKSLATPYLVEAEEYLKGQAGSRISLLQVSQINIADSPVPVSDTTQRPYEVGERYVLFLKKAVMGDYFGAVGEPSAFHIRDGKAVVHSGFTEPRSWYKPTPLAKFTATVKRQRAGR